MNDRMLLNATFDEPISDEWTVVDQAPYSKHSSNWQVQSGELWQTKNYYGFVGGMINAPGTYLLNGSSYWRDYQINVRLRSDDDDAIGVIFRYVDRDNYYRFSMDRERTYRRLIKKENGNVTVLWEDNEKFCLSHAYDLNIDCHENRLMASIDGESLFNVTDTAHLAGRVGLYCRANKAARFEHLRVMGPLPSWTTYHIFEDPTEWADGTKLRLHSDNNFRLTKTAEHFKANAETEFDPLFSPYGTDIRIVAPDGSILHKRHFSANNVKEIFSTINLRLLRKADGTALAFVRPLNQGSLRSLEPGTYRIAFRFRRDNRNVNPQSIVLRQNGDSSDETVILDVPWDTVM